MFTAAECRAIALQKIEQARQDKRHCRKLKSAAESWLFLAQKLDEFEDKLHRRNLTSATEAWLCLARKLREFEDIVAVAHEVDDEEDINYRAA
jgi:hypothetical protein